jgi:hypothetical protein
MNNTRAYQVTDAVPSPNYLAEAENQLTAKDIELLDEYCASIKRTKVLKSHVCHFNLLYFEIPQLLIVILINVSLFHSFKMWKTIWQISLIW